MYAVIFRAKIKELDAQYSKMAERMRTLAINEYGCIEFTACTEGNDEIAISYWPSLEHIKAWHQNPEHKIAQELGKTKWYDSYQVQVTEVLS
ncbi:antibiotic biosynthesis monooxygenase [Pseudoalteromonas sp. APC 3224]|uniref:antibiotic biosynthesis monooxygenase family protein n=1 Tax=Pseudoalteromonas sp. APC 3224 TaxID=3035203 RepID=UPI0025B294F1|nr:antibiotic biosynthesis monooxygenase [Pseudoalteromonas sp. APC 3224]MDN3485467.1 antibiotic biosynthesis monooxygenase [Pseudoalteromonas sp. APC 3224]